MLFLKGKKEVSVEKVCPLPFPSSLPFLNLQMLKKGLEARGEERGNGRDWSVVGMIGGILLLQGERPLRKRKMRKGKRRGGRVEKMTCSSKSIKLSSPVWSNFHTHSLKTQTRFFSKSFWISPKEKSPPNGGWRMDLLRFVLIFPG